MSAVAQLAYLVFEVSDLEAWRAFAQDIVKAVVEDHGSRLAIRLDQRQARIWLEPGPADDVVALGWQVDPGRLAALCDRLDAAGRTWTERGDLAAERGVSRLLLTEDPAGVPLELVVDPRTETPPQWPHQSFDGFVTGDMGVGHLVVTARDRQESEDFYRQALGFSLSDRIVTRIGDFEIDLAFLHVNARHHSLAFGGPQSKRIHHFMLQYRALDDLGRALDRAMRAGIVLTSLGRHPNDRMLSFYARTPSGFQVELGWGGVEIQVGQWKPTTFERIATWGHRPLQEAR